MVDRPPDTHTRDVKGAGAFVVKRRERFWEVRDPAGELVCVTVYKRGAEEVVWRLHAQVITGSLPSLMPMRSYPR